MVSSGEVFVSKEERGCAAAMADNMPYSLRRTSLRSYLVMGGRESIPRDETEVRL